MKCRELDELLSAYSDGELSLTQREFVEAHLAGCSDCRATLEKYTTVRQQILSLRQVPVMKEIKASILTKASERRTARKLKNWLPPAAVRISISGVLLAALAIGLVGHFNNSGDGDFWTRVEAATQKLSEYRATFSVGDYVMTAFTYNAPNIYEYEWYDYSIFSSAYTPGIGQTRATTKAPNKSSFTRILNGIEETIVIGDRVYVQTPEKIGLLGATTDTSKLSAPEKPRSLQDTIASFSWFTKLEQLADEKIDGVLCAHFLGEYNTINLEQKIVDSLDPQDPRYQIESSMLADLKKKGGTEVQTELWIGKKDYLLREIKSVEINAGLITPTPSISHFYYNNVHVSKPINSSGTTLQGWYLITNSGFTAVKAFVPSVESDVYTTSVLQIELTNSGQQTSQNVQVFAEFGGVRASNTPPVASLPPGEKSAFLFRWLLEKDVQEYTPIFVEYSTSDGISHVQLLNPTQ